MTTHQSSEILERSWNYGLQQQCAQCKHAWSTNKQAPPLPLCMMGRAQQQGMKVRSRLNDPRPREDFGGNAPPSLSRSTSVYSKQRHVRPAKRGDHLDAGNYRAYAAGRPAGLRHTHHSCSHPGCYRSLLCSAVLVCGYFLSCRLLSPVFPLHTSNSSRCLSLSIKRAVSVYGVAVHPVRPSLWLRQCGRVLCVWVVVRVGGRNECVNGDSLSKSWNWIPTKERGVISDCPE